MANEYISRARLREIIGDINDMHPYKVTGDYDTYSRYNEGWQDACNLIESMIDVEDGTEMVPLDYHERCLGLEVTRRIQAERPNRVLIMEDLIAHVGSGADATPLWIQFRRSDRSGRWALVALSNEAFNGAGTIARYLEIWPDTYNIRWRCWLRKPTAKEMQKEAWGK